MVMTVQRLPLPPALPQPGRGKPSRRNMPPAVCRYWKAGNCNRHTCPFLHTDVPDHPAPPTVVNKRNNTWVNPSRVANSDDKGRVRPVQPKKRQAEEPPESPAKRRCGVQGPAGGAWCVGDGFCGVQRLKGHAKEVTGVALPEGSDKLFSGSLDGTVRAWDCNTGECVHVAEMQEGEVRKLIAMGPWVLVGVRGFVRAVHQGTGKELRLRGPTSPVTAMLAEDDMHLFAGAEDGAVYMWRMNQEQQSFDEVAALTGHDKAVVSLAQGKGALYSGSADGSIRVWDLETHRCIYSFAGHSSAVTALLCWERFLLSSSDDGTVKVWQSRPDHDGLDLEVHYTHEEDERVVSIDGTYDADEKPVLLVSRGDGVVRVYDLPSMKKRGDIHCDGEVRTMSVRSHGVVFTGDASGEVRVVKWTPLGAAAAQA
ncbi:zinc finger CCCH domain-containing protein 48-like [Oryza brachyantha]|uniref:C3H1-type domain-containing protein n=1 Tax=Oryza brachyantha TaxID=4533 RepID=J3LJY7_ORYBR|nr:zinc finger CCCH domain-containing protein 48-like [Oryza brachyantha]